MFPLPYTERKREKPLNANSKRQDYTFPTLFSNAVLKLRNKSPLLRHAKKKKWTIFTVLFAWM